MATTIEIARIIEDAVEDAADVELLLPPDGSIILRLTMHDGRTLYRCLDDGEGREPGRKEETH